MNVVKSISIGACVLALFSMPMLTLSHANAQTRAKAKAQWGAPKAPKSTKTTKATPANAARAASPSLSPSTSPAPTNSDSQAIAAEASNAPAPIVAQSEAPIQDQSQEVLDIDLALSATIAASGPRIGYGNALSDEGVLFDANGSSPKGQEAATSRFETFPADVSFIRTPEKAVAAGGSGSSWGAYAIKRGETLLSSGRYISVWRREAAGWRMISELAAGRNAAPPASAPNGSGAPALGPLPRRPAQLGREAPQPVGVPLTVPGAPPSTPAAAPDTTPPAPPTP